MYQFARPLVPAEGVSGKYRVSPLRLPFCLISVHVSTLLTPFYVPGEHESSALALLQNFSPFIIVDIMQLSIR